MEIIGTQGIVRLKSGFAPSLSLLLNPDRVATSRVENWQTWNGGVDSTTETTFEGLAGYDASHRRVVRDWLDAIREQREPLASGERALKAIEMAHGVFAAGISGERVPFPLMKRTHPLM
jgi:predicted dehydrogenase